jgi:phospholipid/cholesterol/gamma-HCH transport system substrate-binding protein
MLAGATGFAAMNNTTVETIIGAAVIAVAVGFFGYAYKASGASGTKGGMTLEAEFDNIEGINVGSDVRLAGIKIGTVIAQKINPESYQAVVTMALDQTVALDDDTGAKITAEGLLGSKFVSIDPGGSGTKLADGGKILQTQGAVDIWSLISQAMFDKSKSGKDGGGTGGDTQPAPQ